MASAPSAEPPMPTILIVLNFLYFLSSLDLKEYLYLSEKLINNLSYHFY